MVISTSRFEFMQVPVSRSSKNLAHAFTEMLKGAGLTELTVDEVGDAIGPRPGPRERRVVASAGRIDTVFPLGTDGSFRFAGDWMYVPGIGDNTCGLVVTIGRSCALCSL